MLGIIILMDREQLKTEFENLKDGFDTVKESVESQIVETKYSKGYYFETIPFSYQRSEFSQGKLLDNINKIKTTKNLNIYGFDNAGRIIEIKTGTSIENQFYFQFLLYEREYVKSVLYDNQKTILNVSFHLHDEQGRFGKLLMHGKRGGREELYVYSENGKLDYVSVIQIDKNGNKVTPYKEKFEYTENGFLKKISKIFDNGFSRQTFLQE